MNIYCPRLTAISIVSESKKSHQLPTMSTTSLADIHPHILQAHILPRLDGPSLSAVATVSSSLQALCSDQHLWAQIINSTWPSINHPLVDDVISTFPDGHRSFFQDSFPSLITDVNHHNRRQPSWCTPKQDCISSCVPDCSSHNLPSEIISAVDIRYKNEIIYSSVRFTDTTTDFLCSAVRIELNEDPTSNRSGSKPVTGISRSIDLKVDELAGADEVTLSHLKESLTLNWILIDPTLKRAADLSSIKAVSARQDWMSSETILQYVTVLPGCESNEMVKCKIQVVLGIGGVGLHVKKVVLKCEDLDANCVSGEEFLVISEAALMEENNVTRKVVVDSERWKSHKEFKEMRRVKKEWAKKEEEKREFDIKMNYIGIFVSFCFSLYVLSLLL